MILKPKVFEGLHIRLLVGSQELYGQETLQKVFENAGEITAELSASEHIHVRIVMVPVLTSADSIRKACLAAIADEGCIGVILWAHTFSPGQMWIEGLKALSAVNMSILHLHTQYHPYIPHDELDMDMMNLHQSAHGDRELGAICTRMGIRRTVVVGHWRDSQVQKQIGMFARVAAGAYDSRQMKVAQIGGMMRDVCVTWGDPVAARRTFGYAVEPYGVGDLVKFIDEVSDDDTYRLIDTYKHSYVLSSSMLDKDSPGGISLHKAAKIELGLRAFLKAVGAKAFTTNFESLTGLDQLPGIAVQRLMAEGYGFGAEGDVRTAALLRTVGFMSSGLPGGCSFMEHYMNDFEQGRVLGAHMLEISPAIAFRKPRCEVHPLSIGGKEDPVRLVFGVAPTRSAINASVVDIGHRFRIIVNKIRVVEAPEMPRLPVARVLWEPLPDLATEAATWILGGGAHHTVFSSAVTPEYLQMFAQMNDVECLTIDEETTVESFKRELRQGELYYSRQ